MQSSSNKTIAKNAIYLYVRMLLVMAITLYTSRVILQVLGASDYGIYNVVGGVVTMLAFLNNSLGASTSRFLTYELGVGDKEKLKKTFSASLNLHLFIALLVLVLGETVGLWFFYEKLVIPEERMDAAFWVYQFSIITTMVAFTQVPYNASLISHENMSIYAYIGLYEAISQLAIVYLLTVSPIDKLVFYALLLMVNKILIQTFYRIYTAKKYDECRFGIVKDGVLYKKLLSYSGWELFGGLAVVCQGQGMNIVLNLFFGPIVNAARAIAVQIQTAITVFVQNFLTAIRPQVIKSHAEGNITRMYNLTFAGAKYSYLLTLCIVLPLIFEINFVLSIWLGNDVPDNTAIFSVIVLVTYLMETFHLASLMAYHAIGKIKLGNIVGGSLMITALPLAYILLKMGFPAYSAFVSIFVVNLTQMFFGWYIVHRYVPFCYRSLIKRVYIPDFLITLISIIPPLLITRMMVPGWTRLITLLFSTEIVLLLSTYLIALTRDERERVNTLIKNKLHR